MTHDLPGAPALADLVRAHVEGTLDAPQAAVLERKAAESEDVAAFLAAYREVDAAFAEGEADLDLGATPPLPNLAAADLPSLPAPTRTRSARWSVAAAAAVVLCGLAAAGLHSLLHRDGVVTLAAIPAPGAPAWTPAPAEEAALRSAAAIADLPDVPDPWFRDLEAARDAARVTGRPVLVFLQHPSCPICRALEEGTLRDSRVRERVARCAAVRVGAFEDLDDPNLDREWPYLGIQEADGREVAGISAPQSADALCRVFDEALARVPSGAAMPWARARVLAAGLVRAADAEIDERPDAEWAALAAVASAEDGGAFAAAARGRLRERAREASAALAHALSARDPHAVLRRLDDLLERHAGTPWGEDLARVRAACARLDRVPEIEWAEVR